MAGRKPKPTAVKKLEGNPGKRHGRHYSAGADVSAERYG